LINAKQSHGDQIGAQGTAMLPLARQRGFNSGSVYQSLPDKYLTQSHTKGLIARRSPSRFSFVTIGDGALSNRIIVKSLRGWGGPPAVRYVRQQWRLVRIGGGSTPTITRREPALS
jgi:hypothetical protein